MFLIKVEAGEVTDIKSIDKCPDTDIDEYDIYDGKYGEIYVSNEDTEEFIHIINGYGIYEDLSSNDRVVREVMNTFKNKEEILAYKLISKDSDFARKLKNELVFQLGEDQE